MSGTAGAERRMCRIECFDGGHWHRVGRFAVGDASAEAAAKAGIEALCSLDETSAFRLVADDTGRTAMNYCFARGWTLGRGVGEQPARRV